LNTTRTQTPQAMPKKAEAPAKPTALALLSDRYHVPNVGQVLAATAFSTGKGEPPPTVEEMHALAVVANEYHLNPFTREIYAFRNKRTGGIVPIVGIDGWIRIVERQPAYDGEEMKSGFDETIGPNGGPLGFYYECFIYRKDRRFPISRRQYYAENFRETDPWRQMPTRMLQHRAYIQSARAAFGFGGIYDEDEGEVIALGKGVDYLPANTSPRTAPPQAKQQPIEAGDATGGAVLDENQLELIREKLAVTGIPDNLVMARFEVGSLEEIPAAKAHEVVKFITDNAP